MLARKANYVLNFILLALIIITMRIWHLAVIQYDQKVEESKKPQRKVIIEPATRATIRDRFNLPLAVNKIQYQAAILYTHLKDIPSFRWEKDEEGKKVKRFKRKEYIHQLSQLLAKELNLDAERIEDLIHAKASYYAQVPFVIKEELSEKEYYRLRILQREWPGIYVRRVPKRYYPRGRVAADVIGYMGAINRQEYEKILHEIKVLEKFIVDREQGEDPELPLGMTEASEARKRLKDLEQKAYTIHDYIGKTGVEGVFEEQLRGFYGKKIFYSDSKGNFLRELPGSRAPLSGHRLLLAISVELQEYAEQLLTQNEEIRLVRMSQLGAVKQTVLALKHPWIKGGAIVAMDPNTGEVLTLASYPRFDPNDFISSGGAKLKEEKRAHINRWFESESYVADVWNQQQPLERERYDDYLQEFYDEKRLLTWETYLDFTLPAEGELRKAIDRVITIEQAFMIQNGIDRLLDLFNQSSLYAIFNLIYNGDLHTPYPKPLTTSDRKVLDPYFQEHQAEIKKIKRILDPYLDPLSHNYDKVLVVDLCRLMMANDHFSSDLIAKVGRQSNKDYHDITSHVLGLMTLLKEKSRELYHTIDFKEWRQREEKEFLKQKRIEEKATKTYPKPYLDYLDQQEQQGFQLLWDQYKWDFILTFLMGKEALQKEMPSFNEEGLAPYLDHFDSWYQKIKLDNSPKDEWHTSYQIVQRVTHPLSYSLAKQYLQGIRSYHELTRPLLGRYRSLRKGKIAQEKHLAAAFYPIYGFGYGRSHAYRQAAIQGSIFKLITAYETLIQKFKKLDRKHCTFQDLNPLVIVDKVYYQDGKRYVGYHQDGKSIPQLYKGGRLPRSLAHRNNGEVDLIRALEVSSNPYFSLLAGECLENPDDLPQAARLFSYGNRTGIDLPAEISGKIPDDVAKNRTGLYALAIGQHSLVVTPLQTAVMLSSIANGGKVLKPKIVNLTAGRQPSRGDDPITCLPDFRYQEYLSLVGIDFPLFTAMAGEDQKSLVQSIPTEVKREVFMPTIVRQILLRGLRAAVLRTHIDSSASLAKLYKSTPEAMNSFNELKYQLLGKTSTSESVENIDLDLQEGTNIYTHVWFGGIAFQQEEKGNKNTFLFTDEFGQPELVVVVYLRFGGYGKEAAPLAAQMVKKWRELKEKYSHQL